MAALCGSYGALVHVSMSVDTSIPMLIAGSAVLGAGASIAFSPPSARYESAVLWRVSFALGIAFWCYNLLRRVGYAAWPNAHIASMSEYLYLLYMQFVLFATMGVGCLWAILALPPGVHLIRIGTGARPGERDRLRYIWFVALALLFGLLTWYVATRPLVSAGVVTVFVVIAAVKALLSACTEESVFRGVLLPCLSARFGIRAGILVQAILYAVFHFYVFAPNGHRAEFAGLVFVFGLLLGWVSMRTRGLLWPVLMHTTIGMFIEWSNLSRAS